MQTRRRKVEFGTLQNLIMEMSEGNPGAMTALIAVSQEPDESGTHNFMTMLSLDDMNMRGPQIWVAWKYFCEGDTPRFIAKVGARDSEMVEYVNSQMGVGEEIAVTSGASYQHA